MSQNFFITGMPKAGKTTLLHRIVDELKKEGLKVGGVLSPEEKHHGTRTGFWVMDIESGKISSLADVNTDGPKVSKYHVDVKSFESIALPIMDRFEEYDVVVIDEIGRMELKSLKFSDMLDKLLESDTPLIASLQENFVEKYHTTGEVLFLSDNNREAVYTDLLNKIKTIGKKPMEVKKMPPKRAERKVEEIQKKEVKPAKKKTKKEKKMKPKEEPEAHREKTTTKKTITETKPRKKEERKGVFDRMKDLFGV